MSARARRLRSITQAKNNKTLENLCPFFHYLQKVLLVQLCSLVFVFQKCYLESCCVGCALKASSGKNRHSVHSVGCTRIAPTLARVVSTYLYIHSSVMVPAFRFIWMLASVLFMFEVCHVLDNIVVFISQSSGFADPVFVAIIALIAFGDFESFIAVMSCWTSFFAFIALIAFIAFGAFVCFFDTLSLFVFPFPFAAFIVFIAIVAVTLADSTKAMPRKELEAESLTNAILMKQH